MELLQAIAKLSFSLQQEVSKYGNAFPLWDSDKEQQTKKGDDMLSIAVRIFRKGIANLTNQCNQQETSSTSIHEWFSTHKLPHHLYWDSLWIKQFKPACRKTHLATAIIMTGIDRQTAINLAEGILALAPSFDINSPPMWSIRNLLETKMYSYLRSLAEA